MKGKVKSEITTPFHAVHVGDGSFLPSEILRKRMLPHTRWRHRLIAESYWFRQLVHVSTNQLFLRLFCRKISKTQPSIRGSKMIGLFQSVRCDGIALCKWKQSRVLFFYLNNNNNRQKEIISIQSKGRDDARPQNRIKTWFFVGFHLFLGTKTMSAKMYLPDRNRDRMCGWRVNSSMIKNSILFSFFRSKQQIKTFEYELVYRKLKSKSFSSWNWDRDR